MEIFRALLIFRFSWSLFLSYLSLCGEEASEIDVREYYLGISGFCKFQHFEVWGL